MLSSLYSLQPREWHRPGLVEITDYNIDKFFADNYLINNTALNYTIIQPANLTEKLGTGKITVNNTTVATNPIPDVAQTLADILDHENTSKHVIMMSSGETPINEALATI